MPFKLIVPSFVSRFARLLLAGVAGLALFGCAVTLPSPTATAGTTQQLRDTDIAPLATGRFALAPGKNPSMDQSQGGLRGSSVAASTGSFAQYLRDVIVAELKSAGLYDEKSPIVIDAQLVDSQLDAAITTGTGRLAARFTVTRQSKLVYDKELSVDGRWESSFVGAVAIPEAINRYGELYKLLAAKLFSDPDFLKAATK